MIHKFNPKRSLSRNVLIFVFSLLSVTASHSVFAVDTNNNQQLLHIDEKNKIFEVSNEEKDDVLMVNK
ncbi:MAG TPA: hypothetical protein DCY20_06030, partial [Firmicutes bacterium]|nr:hypothetical protein [Bacillota bacterium]